MGKTIFFSSHILSAVADICTSIAILEAGQLVAFGDMDEMKRQLRAHRLVQVRVLGPLQPLQAFLLQRPDVHSMLTAQEADLPSDAVRFDFSGDDAALSNLRTALVQTGIPVISFTEESGDLEDVFLHATKGIVR